MAEPQATSANGQTIHGNDQQVMTESMIGATLLTDASLERLLHDPSLASQPPYQVLASRLPFGEASKFWWNTSAAPISQLMTRTGYPIRLHYRYLLFYYDIVLPGYGPIPSHNDREERGWTGSITPDASPFEPSWNLRTTGTSESVIRFTIEANSLESATEIDPINQKTTQDIVRRAAAAEPSFDLEIYNYITDELFLSNEEAQKLRKQYPDHLSPQAYLAFDFEKTGRILGKFTGFFNWRAKQLNQSPRDVAFNLIANIPRLGTSLLEPLRAWDKCIREFPALYGGEPRVECMSFDLIQPSHKFRIKPYSRLWNSSFAAVTHFYTLGGIVKDASALKGLEYLKLFWHIVCGVPDDEQFMTTEIPVLHQGWADIIVNWELKPGEPFPQPKFYMPIWKWIENDDEVIARLERFWREIGWIEQAETYRRDWEDAFPWLDGDGFGGMNYVSLAWKDDGTGLYMSLYLSPKVHVAVEKGVGSK